MATKAEYLADLESKTYVQEVGTAILSDEDFTDIDINIYTVNVLEKVGTDKAVTVKHKFAVYKEGLGGETVFDDTGGYSPAFDENDSVRSAITSYLDGRSEVYGYRIINYKKSQNWAKAHIFKFVTDHIEEVYYLVYDDSGLTHLEITVTA